MSSGAGTGRVVDPQVLCPRYDWYPGPPCRRGASGTWSLSLKEGKKLKDLLDVDRKDSVRGKDKVNGRAVGREITHIQNCKTQ